MQLGKFSNKFMQLKLTSYVNTHIIKSFEFSHENFLTSSFSSSSNETQGKNNAV